MNNPVFLHFVGRRFISKSASNYEQMKKRNSEMSGQRAQISCTTPLPSHHTRNEFRRQIRHIFWSVRRLIDRNLMDVFFSTRNALITHRTDANSLLLHTALPIKMSDSRSKRCTLPPVSRRTCGCTNCEMNPTEALAITDPSNQSAKKVCRCKET